jgi:hypothetical protein
MHLLMQAKQGNALPSSLPDELLQSAGGQSVGVEKKPTAPPNPQSLIAGLMAEEAVASRTTMRAQSARSEDLMGGGGQEYAAPPPPPAMVPPPPAAVVSRSTSYVHLLFLKDNSTKW